ncbi:50S ribosomal protein L29 [Buchnera aphidicola (Eriosoma grossulariae)]|uniref:50S ribosomal protein L29 n=1 Tax=Buchnera aphidicola TaxID=9 RepID=UPI003464C1DD
MHSIELKKKTLLELKIELLDLFREQFNLKIQLSAGKLQKYHLLRNVRRNIAQVKTLISENNNI